MNPEVQRLAKKILLSGPVYLDTETTGLENDDQVVEISIIDSDGSVLLNSLVRSTIPMKSEAQAIHGISDEMLQYAPSFAEILPDIRHVLKDRVLVIYNAEYDIRMMCQSSRAHGQSLDIHSGPVHCAMKLYAHYYGEASWKGGYKWQTLSNAISQQGIKLDCRMHRAYSDTLAIRLLMLKMGCI